MRRTPWGAVAAVGPQSAAVTRPVPTPASVPLAAVASARSAPALLGSVLSRLLGQSPQAPLGWGVLAVARGEIGRSRRVVAGAATSTAADPASTAAPPEFARDEVLVTWRQGSTAVGRWLTLAIADATVLDELGTQEMLATNDGVVYRLQVPGGTEAAIRLLSKSMAVDDVEPNYWVSLGATSNDPFYTSGSLWGMQSDDSPTPNGPVGTTNQYGIGAEEAWAQGVTGSRSVVVGVIDEGIQITHPDLAANIWRNPGEIAGDGIDNDRNGYVDDVNGWDFYHDDNTVYDPGEDAHGTHVAGTIAAVGGNATGVAGVGWNTAVVPAKFLGPQGGYISDAVDALNYLTDLKTRYRINLVAVNNSWSGGGYSNTMQAAINRAAKADILFVVAAGNSSSNNDISSAYPSNYSSLTATAAESAASYDSVIAVASITSTGALSSFSSYGANTVDIGAPGSGVISTVPTDAYASYSGTSMATPHVTGALALYASQNPSLSAAGLRAAILGNAKPTPALAGKTVTGGRLSLEGLFVSSELPAVSISPVNLNVVEGNSGTTAAQFTVSLSAVSANAVTVNYTTADGTATAAQDYTASSGTLTFAAGQTSGQISVNVLGDATVEPDETFTVTLSSPTGAQLGSATTATATILSDDVPGVAPLVSINPASRTVSEGNSGTTAVQFTVTLSAASQGSVAVNYATADGTATAGQDYTAASGVLTFAAGQTSRQISVNVLGDTAAELDETFTVSLSSPSGGQLGAPTTATATIVNDDARVVLPVVSIGPKYRSVAEGNSGVAAAQFTVSLSAPAQAPVTVNYATANGTAVAGLDYAGASGTLTFAVGQATQQINVNAFGDVMVEPDETFTITLSAPTGAQLGSATTATGVIVNDDRPTLSISPVGLGTVEGNSGTTQAKFAVSLSAPADAPVTVKYATANGSAIAGQDYTSASGTVSFVRGQTSQEISVTVAGDTTVEQDETFTVALSAPTGAELGSAAKATGTIVNDDLPVVTISPVNPTVLEGISGVTAANYTVALSAPAPAPVTVKYATSNGSATGGQDFASAVGTLTIGVGQSSVQVSVNVVGDKAVEPDETFTVTLSVPIGAILGTPSSATTTIVNDDAPVVSISPATLTVAEGNSGVTAARFTVSLSVPPTAPVTVKYATADGSASAGQDYTATSGTLNFAAGQTSQQFSVNVTGDNTVERNETLTVALSAPTGARLGSATASTVTIVNDDLPVATISPAMVSVTEGGPGAMTPAKFTVSLSAPAPAPVTVQYTTSNGTATGAQDYAAASGKATIAAGLSSAQISVNVIGDRAVEPDETFMVSLSSATGAQLGAAKTATGKIVNDDLPVVSISPLNLSVVEGNSGVIAAKFTVSLSAPPVAPVTVKYSTADGSALAGQDYTAASGTVTFEAGQTSRQLSVNVTGDKTVESDETFTVMLSAPAGAQLGAAKATATILSDDIAPAAKATAVQV